MSSAKFNLNMFTLNDKVILVTGAASGIGAEVARAALRKGAKHIVILDIKAKLGKALEEELNAKYNDKRVKFIKCDVTKDLDTAFKEAVYNFGYIDVVVNNAGILNDAPHVCREEIAINLTALVMSSLKTYRMMHLKKGGKGGTIINISSAVGLIQSHTLPVYSATKSAVLQFSNCLGMDENYNRSGVRVITICFGATDTSLIKGKIGVIDKALNKDMAAVIQNLPTQKVATAARGLIEAYEKGASGSTWLVANGKPAIDITSNVKKAYETLAQGVFS